VSTRLTQATSSRNSNEDYLLAHCLQYSERFFVSFCTSRSRITIKLCAYKSRQTILSPPLIFICPSIHQSFIHSNHQRHANPIRGKITPTTQSNPIASNRISINTSPPRSSRRNPEVVRTRSRYLCMRRVLRSHLHCLDFARGWAFRGDHCLVVGGRVCRLKQ
jgi:hypothetical protein